jgi:2-hydroxy-3-keto-5-methylthiopentenyl-1-phosphate phosphatase
MEVSKKLLLIDFCGTLTTIQTGDNFVFYCIKHNFLLLLVFISIKIYQLFKTLINKVFRVKLTVSKKDFLFLIKNFNPIKIDFFSKKYSDLLIKKFLRKDVIEYINKNFKDYKKIVLSAGYKPYIDKVNSNFLHYDDVFASNFNFDSYGRIVSLDRSFYGFDKLNFFNSFTLENPHFNDIVLFTDSVSDLPLAKVCNKTIFCYPKAKLRNRIKLHPNWEIFKGSNT